MQRCCGGGVNPLVKRTMSLRILALALGAIVVAECKEGRAGKSKAETGEGEGDGVGMGMQLFRLGMDRNADGKVTRKELEAWFAREGDDVVSDGVDYFMLLDANSDGSISPKEADNFMQLLEKTHAEWGAKGAGSAGDMDADSAKAEAAFSSTDEGDEDDEVEEVDHDRDEL
jgi:hypothetical protein